MRKKEIIEKDGREHKMIFIKILCIILDIAALIILTNSFKVISTVSTVTQTIDANLFAGGIIIFLVRMSISVFIVWKELEE